MNASEQYRLGTLLIAEIAKLSMTYWPDDAYAFARAVQKLPNNSVGKKFWIANGTLGKVCPDFREIQTLMHSATLISHSLSHNKRFEIEITKRGSEHLLRRIRATPEESAEAKTLLLAHWEEVCQRPWKDENP